MITGSMKDRIDSMWDMIAAGGIVNPLDVIEQITYLLFIRDLEKRAELIADLHMRWSELRKLPDETLFDSVRDRVFPWLRSLRANGAEAGFLYMRDLAFKKPFEVGMDRGINWDKDFVGKEALAAGEHFGDQLQSGGQIIFQGAE